MRVLVWIEYGNINVFEANLLTFDGIKNQVINVVQSNGYDDQAVEELKHCSDFPALCAWVCDFTVEDDSFQRFKVVPVQC